MGQNCRNSSRPPSSDSPFTKLAPRSLRRRSGKKPGGQPGHPGSTLALVDDPDERRRHEPGPCAGGGAGLTEAPEVGVERRQVFDLPAMTVRVTEHQLIARHCACGATTCGAAPEGVSAPVQYGGSDHRDHPVPLCGGSSCPRSAPRLRWPSLFGTPVSEGTVATMSKRAADGLDGFLAQVKVQIAASDVAGFDETGLRVAGRACHGNRVSHG